MSPPALRVFINERLVLVAPGRTVGAAVSEFDSQLLTALREGRALLTDGRGLPVSPDDPVHSGAIFRVVVSSRSAAAGADALS